jgi:hypothetical protein
MSITYLNRLLVVGTPNQVKSFRDTMRRTVHRRIGRKSWDEQVPFSLERLATITGMPDPENYAEEPYTMSAWPIRRVTPRRAEIRYQFETMNLEMPPPIKRLSRRMPGLNFRLLVHCLDDDSPESFEIRAGRVRTHSLSDQSREQYWQAAGKKFGLSGDDIYDDDEVTFFAEERMREDVLNIWETPKTVRRRDWWNRPAIRLMMDEMELAVLEIGEALSKTPSKDKQPARRRRRAKR